VNKYHVKVERDGGEGEGDHDGDGGEHERDGDASPINTLERGLSGGGDQTMDDGPGAGGGAGLGKVGDDVGGDIDGRKDRDDDEDDEEGGVDGIAGDNVNEPDHTGGPAPQSQVGIIDDEASETNDTSPPLNESKHIPTGATSSFSLDFHLRIRHEAALDDHEDWLMGAECRVRGRVGLG